MAYRYTVSRLSAGWRVIVTAMRRSDDRRIWSRIDDDAHHRGRRYRVIPGIPRREGRVYPGTDGRGLFYDDPMEAR